MTRSAPRSLVLSGHRRPEGLARLRAHWRRPALAAALTALAGLGAFMLLAALPGMPAHAAGPEPAAVVQARYQAERQACLAGGSGQDTATCLTEAGAARADALRHRLDNGESAMALRANALARCAVQPLAERPACELLASGQGMESGSVKAGGVMRESVTRSVDSGGAAKPAVPTRPASPASAAERAAPASAPASGPRAGP